MLEWNNLNETNIKYEIHFLVKIRVSFALVLLCTQRPLAEQSSASIANVQKKPRHVYRTTSRTRCVCAVLFESHSHTTYIVNRFLFWRENLGHKSIHVPAPARVSEKNCADAGCWCVRYRNFVRTKDDATRNTWINELKMVLTIFTSLRSVFRLYLSTSATSAIAGQCIRLLGAVTRCGRSRRHLSSNRNIPFTLFAFIFSSLSLS